MDKVILFVLLEMFCPIPLPFQRIKCNNSVQIENQRHYYTVELLNALQKNDTKCIGIIRPTSAGIKRSTSRYINHCQFYTSSDLKACFV